MPRVRGGVAHAAAVVLQHRGDVVALESLARFAEGPGRAAQGFGAFEPDVRQHVLEQQQSRA